MTVWRPSQEERLRWDVTWARWKREDGPTRENTITWLRAREALRAYRREQRKEANEAHG